MYSHSPRVACETGLIDALEGPVMTKDFKIAYPCNQYKCNHACLCSLYENSHMCPESDHKGHIEDKASECKIVIESECQEHKIKHPKNFDVEEDTGCPTKKFTFFEPVFPRPLISLRKSSVPEMNLWISSFKNKNSKFSRTFVFRDIKGIRNHSRFSGYS